MLNTLSRLFWQHRHRLLLRTWHFCPELLLTESVHRPPWLPLPPPAHIVLNLQKVPMHSERTESLKASMSSKPWSRIWEGSGGDAWPEQPTLQSGGLPCLTCKLAFGCMTGLAVGDMDGGDLPKRCARRPTVRKHKLFATWTWRIGPRTRTNTWCIHHSKHHMGKQRDRSQGCRGTPLRHGIRPICGHPSSSAENFRLSKKPLQCYWQGAPHPPPKPFHSCTTLYPNPHVGAAANSMPASSKTKTILPRAP